MNDNDNTKRIDVDIRIEIIGEDEAEKKALEKADRLEGAGANILIFSILSLVLSVVLYIEAPGKIEFFGSAMLLGFVGIAIASFIDDKVWDLRNNRH